MPRKPDLASMQLRLRIPPRSPLFEHLGKLAPANRAKELLALAHRGLIGGGGSDPETLNRMAVALERMASALERIPLAPAPTQATPTPPKPEDDPRLAALEGRWAGDDD